jgi:hypothetical protein
LPAVLSAVALAKAGGLFFPQPALDLRKTIIIMLSFKLGNALMKLTKIINKPGG